MSQLVRGADLTRGLAAGLTPSPVRSGLLSRATGPRQRRRGEGSERRTAPSRELSAIGASYGPGMPLPFPSPTTPCDSRAEVFLGYLDYFRGVLVAKLSGLDEGLLRSSRLPSGWTPLELAVHLTHVERRWLVWGFEGQSVGQPWGDQRDDRWYVAPDVSVLEVLDALQEQAAQTRRVVESHELSEVGRPGERWDGATPATLERVLFHLLQEYARHVGQLDVVRELIDGQVGE